MQKSSVLYNKLTKLRDAAGELESVAVAFSGGVDSSLLLYVAHEVLGARAVAFTAHSCLFPEHELQTAKAFCESRGIAQTLLEFDLLGLTHFASNPPERCYVCKLEMFKMMRSEAHFRGLAAVVDGSNVDDEGDYRPGLQALAELGIDRKSTRLNSSH